MIYKQPTTIHSDSQDPFGPAPQQMTLFQDDMPGRDLEKMKIKTLLKNFYKEVDNTKREPDIHQII